MRKIFLFFIIVSCSHQLIWAQTSTADSLKKVKADSIHKIDSLRKVDSLYKIDLQNKAVSIKRLISSTDSTAVKNCSCIPHFKTELGFWEWLLVFVPLLIFLIIFFTVGKPDGFVFKEALTENEQTKQTIANPEYTPANLKELKDTPNLSIVLPSTIEVTSANTAYRPSITRYIAFITSLLTLIVALAMSSFFIYHYISTGCPPDLSALSIILIALGIGVAPYAFNKVSTAIKK